MEVGLVRKVDIDQEMQQSYLDYAMSVIVARALPDARDGLKPVQRRILYAMYDMNLRPGSAFKKSARIVGEVLGKYHPHGDVAVYEAMARLAQDFTMRATVVDGQGNFGSVDGDPPAAMRYTEARLTAYGMELLAQIDRNTINMVSNFDDTLSEPEVLPAAVPNLLVNGTSGIAVGMATSIPPHNLGEVIDALCLMLQQWEKLDDLNIQDLMQFIRGPDFPTGGIILQENEQNDLLAAYATGRGRVVVRGRVQYEEMGRGRSRLIITEIPYMVNKSSLIERIAELVREGELEGIADLRDESDRQGMRIVIELKQGAENENVLRELYKRTPLQSTFGISLLALVDGEPHLLTLKQILRIYLEHRLNVVRRRTEFDLERAQHKAHILEGLRIALKNLDEIITLIKNSTDSAQAGERIKKRFGLSELQAQAILEMPLKRLASLERKKIEQDYKETVILIKDLEGLLNSPKRMRLVVDSELKEVKQSYGDRRRTQIVFLRAGESAKVLLTTRDLMPAQEVWVGITVDGIIARTLGSDLPRLSGKQIPLWLVRTNTHHTLYLVSDQGRGAALAVEALPQAEKFNEGLPLNKASSLQEQENIVGVFSVPPRDEVKEERYILTVSQAGLVKKSSLLELPGPSAQFFTLVKVNTEDLLVSVMLTGGKSDLVLATAGGMAIHFSEEDVRPMGLMAAGVNGMKLAGNDVVIGAVNWNPGGEIFFLSANGKAWRLPADEFPLQGRYGQGTIACKLEKGNHLIGVLFGKHNMNGFIHYDRAATCSFRLDEIPVGKRIAAGKILFSPKPHDSIVGLSYLSDYLAFWSGKSKVSRRPGVKKEQD